MEGEADWEQADGPECVAQQWRARVEALEMEWELSTHGRGPPSVSKVASTLTDSL